MQYLTGTALERVLLGIKYAFAGEEVPPRQQRVVQQGGTEAGSLEQVHGAGEESKGGLFEINDIEIIDLLPWKSCLMKTTWWISGPFPPSQCKGHQSPGGGEGEEQGADGGDLMFNWQ